MPSSLHGAAQVTVAKPHPAPSRQHQLQVHPTRSWFVVLQLAWLPLMLLVWLTAELTVVPSRQSTGDLTAAARVA